MVLKQRLLFVSCCQKWFYSANIACFMFAMGSFFTMLGIIVSFMGFAQSAATSAKLHIYGPAMTGFGGLMFIVAVVLWLVARQRYKRFKKACLRFQAEMMQHVNEVYKHRNTCKFYKAHVSSDGCCNSVDSIQPLMMNPLTLQQDAQLNLKPSTCPNCDRRNAEVISWLNDGASDLHSSTSMEPLFRRQGSFEDSLGTNQGNQGKCYNNGSDANNDVLFVQIETNSVAGSGANFLLAPTAEA